CFGVFRIGGGRQTVDLFLDSDVRHHLAADLGEPALPAGDVHEAFFVNLREVAAGIPTVVDDLGRLLRIAEVALHDVRAFDEQEAFGIDAEVGPRFRIDDLNGASRNCA